MYRHRHRQTHERIHISAPKLQVRLILCLCKINGIAYLHQRLVEVERRRGEDGGGRSEEGSESRRGEVDDRRSEIVGYQDHIYSFQSV